MASLEGSMKYLLMIITCILGITSATTEIKYLRGIPRLNDSNYYDYYFSCNAQGRMMQWEVNGTILEAFSGGSVSKVIFGTMSNFSYLATLLSSKNITEAEFMFGSVLIVSCEDMCDLEVICRNESASTFATNMMDKRDLVNEKKINDVFLQYLLTDNIAATNDLKPTNIFICGTNNSFVAWELEEIDMSSIGFTQFDPVGHQRTNLLQDGGSTVRQQSILIGNKPYMLVTVMFVVDSSELTVICGYSQFKVNLTIEQYFIPTSQSKASPTTSDSNVSETSTLTSNTIDITSSGEDTASTGYVINFAAAVSVPIVVSVQIFGTIPLIIICLIIGSRKRIRQKPAIRDVELRNFRQSISNEVPLEIYKTVGDIKNPKNEILDFEYKAFCAKVKFIISMERNDVFGVAKTYITAPEENQECITKIGDNVFIGKIGSLAIGLIKHEVEKECVNFVKQAIISHFPNAKYLLSVGLCYTFNHKVANMGDVLISTRIVVFGEKKKKLHERIIKEKTIIMDDKLLDLMCPKADEKEGIKLTENRTSRHIPGRIASYNVKEDSRAGRLADSNKKIFGAERVAGYFASLQEGIKLQNGSRKTIRVIAIKGVFGYTDGTDNKEWNFAACQAVLHYVTKKLSAIDVGTKQ